MNKRPAQEPQAASFKKHKSSHQSGQHQRNAHSTQAAKQNRHTQDDSKREVDYHDAVEKLPPSTGAKADIPSYTPFTVAKNLPPLPEITNPNLVDSPFRHKSYGYDRSSTFTDITYERLEFLGDAYLELFASRLIYHHFPALQAGAQSQVRELLVKNETLSEYARQYGFHDRVKVADMETMLRDAKDRGNKGLNKILGDVFEAYIAAIVLSDPDNGFARAEAWLTALWAPKLLETAGSQKYNNPSLKLQTPSTADPQSTYNPTAKADLQKRIQVYDAKLIYAPYQDSVELKGDQLGQNRHFIAVYLTGYGYDKKELGRGEGKNKVEAGNWAATQAMLGESKGIVDECEKQVNAMKEKKRREREAKEAAGDGGRK